MFFQSFYLFMCRGTELLSHEKINKLDRSNEAKKLNKILLMRNITIKEDLIIHILSTNAEGAKRKQNTFKMSCRSLTLSA